MGSIKNKIRKGKLTNIFILVTYQIISVFNDRVPTTPNRYEPTNRAIMGPIESDKVIIFFNIYNYKNILEESKVIVSMNST